MMKILIVVFLLTTSAFAQKSSDGLPAACGPRDAGFNVQHDKSQHTIAEAEPGKARVYFIQDAHPFTTNIGVDGAWVGANEGSSYFSITLEPGVHHLCANIESHVAGHQMGLLHFTAEAGQTYYFRTRLIIGQAPEYLAFDPVDSDEAGRMISSYPVSISTPKK